MGACSGPSTASSPRLLGGYERSLAWAMARPKLILASFFAFFLALVAVMFAMVPKDFIPSGDSGRLIAFTEGAQDASFAAMVEHQRALAEIVAKDPNIRSFMSSVGAGGIRPRRIPGRSSCCSNPATSGL
jgi:HAE1 family hydrophobic/amphiphilic exporter-1